MRKTNFYFIVYNKISTFNNKLNIIFCINNKICLKIFKFHWINHILYLSQLLLIFHKEQRSSKINISRKSISTQICTREHSSKRLLSISLYKILVKLYFPSWLSFIFNTFYSRIILYLILHKSSSKDKLLSIHLCCKILKLSSWKSKPLSLKTIHHWSYKRKLIF